ncbi:MAG: pyrroline-5-carboxylate reductase [Deltaproteobacteria bacterium]|nr:pyrroline-5-carboxylate reductase [Deltaproteobacteria bacterium]
MLIKKSIGFLGAGNLAEALIKGLLASGKFSPARISASDRISERISRLAETYEIKVYASNCEAARNADIIFLTVKPNDVRGVLKEIASDISPDKLLISAAAGVTTTAVEETLKEAGSSGVIPVVRAMPNTPAIVLEGATAICAGTGAGQAELKAAGTLFESVGKVVVIDDESLMDVVTGLSGSGPAYVFLFIKALVEASVDAGLREDCAKLLAAQTMLGAAKLVLESPKTLDELVSMVASPNGTTVAGIKRLEEGGFKGVVAGAVEAAVKRARELSAAG